MNEIHRGNRTKFGYGLAWARNYLKRYGVIEQSAIRMSFHPTDEKQLAMNYKEMV